MFDYRHLKPILEYAHASGCAGAHYKDGGVAIPVGGQRYVVTNMESAKAVLGELA